MILNRVCTYFVNKMETEGCHDCNITLNAQVKTEVMEVWKCHATKITINTTVKTVQADLSKELSLHYPKTEWFNQVVWGGVYDIHVTFGDSTYKMPCVYLLLLVVLVILLVDARPSGLTRILILLFVCLFFVDRRTSAAFGLRTNAGTISGHQ